MNEERNAYKLYKFKTMVKVFVSEKRNNMPYFNEDELINIYIALLNAKKGNTNPSAVDDFTAIQNKIKNFISKEKINTLDMMEAIMNY